MIYTMNNMMSMIINIQVGDIVFLTHQAIKKHVVRAVVAEARQRRLPQDLEELRVEWAENVKNG